MIIRKISDPNEYQVTDFHGVEVRDWKSLGHLDRWLYKLQEDALSRHVDLSIDWQGIKRRLTDNGLFATSTVNGTTPEDLKARCEQICSVLQGYFNAEPEIADKRTWQVVRSEKMDVYERQRGRMYWRHYCKSVVRPDLLIGCSADQQRQALTFSPHILLRDAIPSKEKADRAFVRPEELSINRAPPVGSGFAPKGIMYEIRIYEDEPDSNARSANTSPTFPQLSEFDMPKEN